jgi:hypothetical protein
MKFRKILCFITGTLSLTFVVSGCGRSHTVEYYETHEKEREARCEECQKMIPTDMLADRDCQAALHARMIIWNKKNDEAMRNTANPFKTPPKGKGFVPFGGTK